jgi:predicted homoserine dehydrogenase-like protein
MAARITEDVCVTQAGGVTRIGVVGAGFMGSGIAESVASAGMEVTLYEP